MRRKRKIAFLCLVLGLLPATQLPAVESLAESTAVIAAAGDIACAPTDQRNPCHHRETSDLVLSDPTITDVLVLGDNQYEQGSLADYLAAYDPTWGRFKAKTHPVPGNHEYGTPNAQGYRDYFGFPSDPLWYSYNLGDWHVVALDSNCAMLTGKCTARSPQGQFLKQDLAGDNHLCELLYWHHPRFTSYRRPMPTKGFWKIAYDNGVDIILNAHGHAYERFAPQTPEGVSDPVRGIRQFVVGTGGKDFDVPCCPRANLEVTNNTTFGILRMTLSSSTYDWQFVPDLTSGTFTDSGAGSCH
jgi:acid phosphatase type 7